MDISYTTDAPNSLYLFHYADTLNNAFLKELRTANNLEQLTAGQSELEKIKTILDWSSKQGPLSKEDSASYIKWIGKYLFYFDILFDQKTLDSEKFMRINGMSKLTLVPAGHKEPRIFQRSSKINYSYYTNSLNDFYRKPL